MAGRPPPPPSKTSSWVGPKTRPVEECPLTCLSRWTECRQRQYLSKNSPLTTWRLPEINQQPQALFTELQCWVQLIKSRLGCICQLDDKKYFHCFLWNSANFLQFQGTLLFSFISGPIKHWAFSPSPHGPKSLFQKR